MKSERSKRRKRDREIREKSIWIEAEVILDLSYEKNGKPKEETITFKIIHNLPEMRGLSFEDALENWKARTEVHSAKSLCDYINSKTHMTGHNALTMEDYKKLSDGEEPKYIDAPYQDPNNRGGTGHYDDSLSDADPGL